jgi:hypothetical protein
MKRLLFLLLILLLPIGSYLWYRQTPEQQIGRVVDQFLDNVEKRTFSTRRKADVHEALGKVLAPAIEFQGEFPIPTEKMTLEEILAKVDFFHNYTSLIEITEIDRSIKLIGSKAQVYQTADILAAAGKNAKDEQTWELIIDLEKGEDWRIIGVRGTKK